MMTTLLPAADLALAPGEIVLDDTVAPRGPWSAVVAAGSSARVPLSASQRRKCSSSPGSNVIRTAGTLMRCTGSSVS